MNNNQKYEDAFIKIFEITKDDLKDDLKYNTISLWDSVGHMQIVMEIESLFNITMETEDILDFSSFKMGKKILQKKYNIIFEE